MRNLNVLLDEYVIKIIESEFILNTSKKKKKYSLKFFERRKHILKLEIKNKLKSEYF